MAMTLLYLLALLVVIWWSAYLALFVNEVRELALTTHTLTHSDTEALMRGCTVVNVSRHLVVIGATCFTLSRILFIWS